MNKSWYESKTLWVNLLAVVAVFIWGKELDPEIVGAILVVLNIILRLLTKKEIVWEAKK
jgi:hypothetical protein